MIWLNLALVLWIYMTVWYGISLYFKKGDMADLAWGLGFVLMAWLSWWLGEGGYLATFINLMVTIWGLRLFIHIFKRNINKPEDYRYAAWRKEWHWYSLRSYLQIFMLQGLFLYIIALPILTINQGWVIRLWPSVVGFVIWLIGFGFEVVGDEQLRRHINIPDNKGKLITSGLWKYSRHPNYFGEITLWWGIYIMALSFKNTEFTLIGPVLITLLIRFVSGVPMLEKKYEGRVDWENYKLQTSMLIPWWPKS